MEIDINFLKHIGELSRIKLSSDELEKFTPQMKTILQSVDVLKEIDTKGIKPMKRHVSFSELREDVPQISLTSKEALSNTKHSANGLVKVYGKVFGSIEES